MARKRRRGWPDEPEPLPVPVVDNHTHLESIGDVLPPEPTVPAAHQGRPGADDRFGGDREVFAALDPWAGDRHPTVAEHLDRARRSGVDRIVQVGCDLGSIRWTDEVLRHAEAVVGPEFARALVGAVAIHPNEAVLHAGVIDAGPDGLTHEPGPEHRAVSLDDAIAVVADTARANKRIRAIGETGMDLFRTGPRGEEVQREAFRAHIALAKELDLPLQIHDRDAHTQVLEILARDGAPERTVFHCFSGDAEMAEFCVSQGWYLSFAGPVSFKSNDGLRAALRCAPGSLLVVETDAPYLTPDPFRGAPNAPYVLPWTLQAVANITGRPLVEVCAQVSAVSESLYGPW